MSFQRSQVARVSERLDEEPRTLTVVAGPRQVGKTRAVREALAGRSATFIAVDEPFSETASPEAFLELNAPPEPFLRGAAPSGEWLVQRWSEARARAIARPGTAPFIFAIDEVQKIPRWSEIVKGLWDADRANAVPMHVILLGSSPWLMQRGLTESLAGRFEFIHFNHWSYAEMQAAFNFSLEEYLYFGGYPGSAPYIRDEARWRSYVRGSLVQPNIDRDILQMTRVDKPALLKQLFDLGCAYSGQIVSYTKLLGQLLDAGNTVTLAHYLNLLTQAGMLAGLSKYASTPSRRASTPKLNALNTALITAQSPYTFEQARNDRTYWGRLVESAVGAHLCSTANEPCRIYYWREKNDEVDFVVASGSKMTVVEVKSGSFFKEPRGLAAFAQRHPGARQLVVGDGGVALAEFLSRPAQDWLAQ